MGTQLQDVSEDGTRPVVVERLIQYGETHDCVAKLVDCAKQSNTTNQTLAAIDSAALRYAPLTAEVVDAGSGAEPFKNRLKEALAHLDDAGMQLVAASELSKLLDAASDEEADTLYLALLGNVKVDRPPEVVRELAPVVAAYLRSRIPAGARRADVNLNLARARLRRIDLSGLHLHEADVAFADLRHATLRDTNLWRSRGYAVDVCGVTLAGSNLEEARWHSAVGREARFHNCRMVSVVLKQADLAQAEFQQSRLQGAHFEAADLTGARFEGAQLADADFRGSKLDDAALASIKQAQGSEQAKFDADVQAKLN